MYFNGVNGKNAYFLVLIKKIVLVSISINYLSISIIYMFSNCYNFLDFISVVL